MKLAPDEACKQAGQLLQSIGFLKHSASKTTESIYFHWPGRKETLRISSHRLSNRATGQPPIAGRATFSQPLDVTSMRRAVAHAIGMYFMKSKE